MRIAVTGSTGLIGSRLLPALQAAGHTVTPVVRPGSRARGVEWNPATGRIDSGGLENHDAMMHLSGESMEGVWTRARKRRIRESRVRSTSLLATAISSLRNPPSVLITASAIGFYGNRPADERLDESSVRGSGFLADVVAAWEQASEPARLAGIRTAHTRFGLVLSPRGGALGPLQLVFGLGLGGKFGDGRQVWSWVAIDDVIGALCFVLDHPLDGPVNVVAPSPVTNLAFVRTLGRVLRRPTLLSVPAAAMKLALGELSSMLLSGARVVPRKLLDAGYDFQYPELEAALKHVLGR